MSTLISPSLQVQSPQASSSGPRGRGAEQAEGRSFGAVLDRSRAAGTTAASQEVADPELPSSMSGRKPSRPGERKSELTAADVMAMLAPLPANLALVPIDGKASAALASRGTKTVGNAVDGIPRTATPALSADGAVATTEESTGGSPAQASDVVAAADHDAKDAKTEGRPATAIDQPFKDALAESAPARPADKPASDAPALPAVEATVFTTATAGASKPTTSADKGIVSAVAEKAAPAPQQLPASESIKLAAASEPAGAAPIDMASDSGPQAMPQFQSVAAPAADRSNAPTTSTPVLSVAPPVGSDEWGPAIGQQMIRMNASGHQVAELNLNPIGLGPLKVTLTMGDNQAQAMFVSAHESVRKAVEAALPQLRTSLAEQGISLGQTSVGADTRQHAGQDAAFAQQNPSRSPNQPDYPGSAPAGSSALPSDHAPSARPLPRSGAGLDTFA